MDGDSAGCTKEGAGGLGIALFPPGGVALGWAGGRGGGTGAVMLMESCEPIEERECEEVREAEELWILG